MDFRVRGQLGGIYQKFFQFCVLSEFVEIQSDRVMVQEAKLLDILKNVNFVQQRTDQIRYVNFTPLIQFDILLFDYLHLVRYRVFYEHIFLKILSFMCEIRIVKLKKGLLVPVYRKGVRGVRHHRTV